MKSNILYLPSAVITEKGKDKGRVFTIAFALLFVIYAVISPKTVTLEVLKGAENFVKTALPAMLPFAIASGMLIKSGFGEACERVAGRTFRRLFGLNGSLSAAFILGSVSGFPIGAKTVCETYRRGICGKKEAENALALCSNPGLGFTVAGVGGMMWHDTRFGMMAWVSCVLSSLLLGVAFKPRSKTVSTDAFLGDTVERGAQDFSVSRTVAESASEAAETLLRVFVFVAFFRTIALVLWRFTVSIPFFTFLNVPIAQAVTASFFEFSSGVSAIADVAAGSGDNGLFFRLLTVCTLAWSGVSVHMQTAVFTASCGLSMKKYYVRKLLSAVLATVIYLLLSNLIRCP